MYFPRSFGAGYIMKWSKAFPVMQSCIVTERQYQIGLLPPVQLARVAGIPHAIRQVLQ